MPAEPGPVPTSALRDLRLSASSELQRLSPGDDARLGARRCPVNVRAREVVDIAGVRRRLELGGDLLLLGEQEVAELSGRSDRAPGVAARLAGRLAVASAWLALDAASVDPPDRETDLWARASWVEVLRPDGGPPVARLPTGGPGLMLPARVHLSLSHDGGLAAACAIAVSFPQPGSGVAEE